MTPKEFVSMSSLPCRFRIALVALAFTSCASSAGAQSNLLGRHGFEEYTSSSLGSGAGHWVSDSSRQTAATAESAAPRTGARNGACRTTASLDCGMYQDVSAPAAGTYTFSIYANADRPGGLVGVDVNGSLAASMRVETRASYQTPYVMSFPASAGDTIHVWMYSPNTPGSVVVDEASLVLSAAPVQVTTLTWNLQVGQSDAIRQSQMDQIAALSPMPTIVALQEADSTQFANGVYQSRLQAQTGMKWNGVFQRHCPLNSWNASTRSCSGVESEGVAILTPYTIVAQSTTMLPGTDCWHSARGAAHAEIDVHGYRLHVLTTHLSTGTCGDPAAIRQQQVAALKTWAAGIGGVQIVAGDFNTYPSASEIGGASGMGALFANVSGSDTTFPSESPGKRDYWFDQIGGPVAALSSDVVTSTSSSDHYSLRTTWKLYSATAPHRGSAAAVPGQWEAEDFDDGGREIAFADADFYNNGGVGRTDQSVDQEPTGDSGGGYDVGWFEQDEWLNYTINASAGTYTFYARIASPCSGGTIRVEINGTSVGTIAVPNTGGWQAWTTATIGGVPVPSGTSVVRVVGDAASGSCGANGRSIANLNWLKLQ
jgi:endonuclease/exonuclease/phosphatase family metal-dependent hydrolase